MELGGIPAHPHSTSATEGRGLECWSVAEGAEQDLPVPGILKGSNWGTSVCCLH